MIELVKVTRKLLEDKSIYQLYINMTSDMMSLYTKTDIVQIDDYLNVRLYDKTNYLYLFGVYFFFNGNEIIGYCCFSPYGNNRKKVEISHFYIVPEYRNQGFGKYALQAILNKVNLDIRINIWTYQIDLNSTKMKQILQNEFKILQELYLLKINVDQIDVNKVLLFWKKCYPGSQDEIQVLSLCNPKLFYNSVCSIFYHINIYNKVTDIVVVSYVSEMDSIIVTPIISSDFLQLQNLLKYFSISKLNIYAYVPVDYLLKNDLVDKNMLFLSTHERINK